MNGVWIIRRVWVIPKHPVFTEYFDEYQITAKDLFSFQNQMYWFVHINSNDVAKYDINYILQELLLNGDKKD